MPLSQRRRKSKHMTQKEGIEKEDKKAFPALQWTENRCTTATRNSNDNSGPSKAEIKIYESPGRLERVGVSRRIWYGA